MFDTSIVLRTCHDFNRDLFGLALFTNKSQFFARTSHSHRRNSGINIRKGDDVLGPSLSDWPIQSGRSSTVRRPPRDARSTRYDLAQAYYLERQEAHRAAIVAFRRAAQIRLG